MRLRSVRRFVVDRDVVERTIEVLREAGARRAELFVFWSGVVDHTQFRVLTLHVPEQICTRTDHGLSVAIPSAALTRQSEWLVDHGEILGAQVHTHPGSAYHSDADARHAVVTQVGAISVVLSCFAQHGIIDEETEVFRLADSGWSAVSLNLIEVV